MTIENYLSDKYVAGRYGVSRATIWRWAQSGRFPKPVKLSPGCTRWRASDLEQWETQQGERA
ncbi:MULTISPECIES: helix-turn-helix transcriptional regulator [Halomonas]|uniref:helix-turn-helix transcriptional regulator n=1 Tax=Halomonas TaxID=2745 RepID=UPI0011BD962D|nr:MULTISPECIES: AlpA family phage regulatory protein [Halomonas]MDR5890296.1 AlpA family phage regulatory protein [Halomonas salina]WJY05786.1 AlpA family phage regulatory protein [Halomonas halophila]